MYIYNVPPVEMAHGNKGGLAIVVCPELNSQEIFYVNPAAVDYELSEDTCDPLHMEQTSPDRSEQLLPDEDLDIAVVSNAETATELGIADMSPASNHHIRCNSLTRRERRELARRRTRNHNYACQPKDTATRKDNDRQKELLQAITIQLENGFRLTGAYIGHRLERKQYINLYRDQ